MSYERSFKNTAKLNENSCLTHDKVVDVVVVIFVVVVVVVIIGSLVLIYS